MIQKSESASDVGKQATDKQKIQVLKKAVIELRNQKSQLEQSNQSLSDELANLLKEKQENVQTYQPQEAEYVKLIEDLQQQISIFSKNTEQMPIRIQSQSSFSSGQYDNQESQYLAKQIKQLQQEAIIQTNNNQGQLAQLQSQCTQLGKELKSKEFTLAKLSKELEDKCSLSQQLKKNIEDIEQDLYNKIIEQSSINTQLQIKIQSLEQELQSKDLEIVQLGEVIERQKEDMMDLEQQRGMFLQHHLILKNQLLEIDCLFILRENIHGDRVFELETTQKRFVYKANEITDLSVKDDSSFILSINSSKNRKETFKVLQGQDLRKVCKSIKQFLMKAQGKQQVL